MTNIIIFIFIGSIFYIGISQAKITNSILFSNSKRNGPEGGPRYLISEKVVHRFSIMERTI